MNPSGNWNSSKIVYAPEWVGHWLNGELVLSFNPKPEDWQKKRDSGKWKNSPHYAKFKIWLYWFTRPRQSNLV
ncbi:family 16 glycoside hydrolase [Autumnicola musiva]|uniref:family 16 glycoside hydrolase n=1 Tax=Autumnicola musiva TaxID=3075589 RepID=UPI0032C210BC